MAPTRFGFVGSEDTDAAIGGNTVRLTATAALLLGDSVFCDAAEACNKSVTAGDRLKRVGIVVDPNVNTAVRALANIGLAAAAATGHVHVCYSGIAYGINGAGTITAGEQVMFSAATAGRLITATPATDAGKIVGVALTTTAVAGAGVKILVGLC